MQQRPATSRTDWFVFQRWAQYDGELRVSQLRMIGIAAFYAIHLWAYASGSGRLPSWGFLQIADTVDISPRFHLLVTLLALAWLLVSANTLLLLRNHIFPSRLPWITSGLDVLFLTSLICVAAGPRSPLVAGYFLLIVLSGLRFSLPLIRFTTLGCLVGYAVVLGQAKWPARFGKLPEIVDSIPRYQQLIFATALVLTGICMGQIVRRVEAAFTREVA